jgi:YD repeat-containing protein
MYMKTFSQLISFPFMVAALSLLAPIAEPLAATVKWAGCRSSNYGISPFPSAGGWEHAISTMAGYFPGSVPVGLWLVGEIYFDGANSGQGLEFPNPGGTWDSHIQFSGKNKHEQYLSSFDEHGIKVFLQFEPGFAPLDQLFEITYNRYHQHACVIGFGVDVEWYRSTCDGCANATVGDSTARAWETKVKSLNSGYRLFLKHYDKANLPPTYRGDIVFVDDSEQNGDFNGFLREMKSFADFFGPADVMYQIGYPSDKSWWSTRLSPIPKTIGDTLAKRTAQQNCGIVWVDFSLSDVLPTTRVSGTSAQKTTIERNPDGAAHAVAYDISGRRIAAIHNRNGICFLTVAHHRIVGKKLLFR